jgi:hypothetical protein
MIVSYQTDLSTFIDGQAAKASGYYNTPNLWVAVTGISMPKLGEMPGKSLRSIAMPLN